MLLDGRHIGNCGLKNLELSVGRGELWIYLGDPEARGRGIGRRATELLLDEGFIALHLSTIYLHVAAANEPARRLYARLGFTEQTRVAVSPEWAGRSSSIVRMDLERTKR